MKAVKKKTLYEVYTADSLHLILRQLGVTLTRYSDLLYPAPADNRPPEEIALERAANMGLKVVES